MSHEADQKRVQVRADRDVCIGAGVCVRAAPQVFGQDDELGLVVLLSDDPGTTLTEAVRRAVESCPSGALTTADPRSPIQKPA